MIAIFHLAVKCAAAGYLLYKLWIILFRHKLYGLWERIPVKQPCTATKDKPAKDRRKARIAARVVGKSKTERLAKPVKGAVLPIPDASVIVDDTEEDFEVGPDVELPSNEELYGAGNAYPKVADSSTGLTYEQLAETIAYVAAPVEDDERMMRAAEALSLMRGTDLFDIIEREVSNTYAIGRLMDDCLDGNGDRLPKRKSKAAGLDGFSIEAYV